MKIKIREKKDLYIAKKKKEIFFVPCDIHARARVLH